MRFVWLIRAGYVSGTLFSHLRQVRAHSRIEVEVFADFGIQFGRSFLTIDGCACAHYPYEKNGKRRRDRDRLSTDPAAGRGA